jgi:hypothetical protein
LSVVDGDHHRDEDRQKRPEPTDREWALPPVNVVERPSGGDR